MSNKKDKDNLDEDINLENDQDIEEQSSDNDISQEYKSLKEKYDAVELSYQRLLADFENYKRRTAGEILDSTTKGKVEVLEKIVDIVDNFDRSMQYDIGTEEFKKGITMLHNMMNENLKVIGLEEVETEGLLNPDVHQAIMVDENENKEDNEIMEVLQKGYKVEGKLIRPAMVKVNKKNK